MSVSKSLITGRVPLPTDAVASGARLIFTLSAFDTEGAATILPAAVPALLVDGNLPEGFALWPNTAGLRGTSYIVTAQWSESADGQLRSRSARLGMIQIGEAPSHVLADLLNAEVTPASPSFWVQAGAEDVQTILGASEALAGFTAPGYLAAVEAGAATVTEALETLGAGHMWLAGETDTTATFAVARATIVADPGPGPYPSITIEVQ